MTQLGNASFNQANNASNWNPATDGQSWAVQSGAATLSISSNEGLATGVTALTFIQLGSTTSADAEALLRTSVSSTNYTASGIVLRATGTTTFYRARISANSSAIGIGIVKTISGTSTNLFTASFTASINTFYWLRFRVVGTALMAKVWADGSAEPDSWTLSGTDSSITNAGTFGICVNTTSSGDTAKYDSFYAVDYAWADSVPASDTPSFVLAPSFSDALTASDIGRLQQWGMDTLSASDLGNAQQWNVDALTGSATPSFVLAPGFSDALTGSATPSFVLAPGLIEALQASDIGRLQLWGIDALTASDIGNWQRWGIDGLSISDSFVGYAYRSDPAKSLVDIDVVGNGFVVGLPGIYGNVYLQAFPGTSLSVYSSDGYLLLGYSTLADFYFAILTQQGVLWLADQSVNIDQVGGVTVAAAQVPITINIGGVAISNANPVPVQDIEQAGYVAATSPPTNTNSGSETTYTFSSQVSRVIIQNNTGSVVNYAFDQAASAGSLALAAGSLLDKKKKCTALHLYTASSQAINGTSSGNIVVLGAL